MVWIRWVIAQFAHWENKKNPISGDFQKAKKKREGGKRMPFEKLTHQEITAQIIPSILTSLLVQNRGREGGTGWGFLRFDNPEFYLPPLGGGELQAEGGKVDGGQRKPIPVASLTPLTYFPESEGSNWPPAFVTVGAIT